MPSVTDWISSISALVGGLAGVGALIVAYLSYRKANRALAADAQTRTAVGSTFQAIEALGAQSDAVDQAVQAALQNRSDADPHPSAIDDGYVAGREKDEVQASREAYAQAAEETRRVLDEIGRGSRPRS